MKSLPLITCILLLITGCQPDYTPKPRGYFRIDFPEQEYQLFDTTFPYTFEYPVYARILPDHSRMAEPYWINISFPAFHAQLHISYKVIHNNLAGYLEDSRTLVNKHIPKASSITRQEFIDAPKQVYCMVYEIRGSEAASPCQFYLTDSLSRFLRGALYFDLVPNNDSLSPVIDHLKKDIRHMINTFCWKKS